MPVGTQCKNLEISLLIAKYMQKKHGQPTSKSIFRAQIPLSSAKKGNFWPYLKKTKNFRQNLNKKYKTKNLLKYQICW